MKEMYECQACGTLSNDEKDFKTDLNTGIDSEELTCEECYEEMMYE